MAWEEGIMPVRVAGARAERLAKKTWEFLAALPDGALPDDEGLLSEVGEEIAASLAEAAWHQGIALCEVEEALGALAERRRR